MTKTIAFGRAAPVVALFVCSAAGGPVAALEDGNHRLDAFVLAADTAVQEEPLEIVTASGVHTFSIEVARTPQQQQTGLMFRTKLPDTKGMLFPHERPREVQMWMRNTYIPLDMVFIRADGTVHRIEKMTEPFSERVISSNGEVSAVLEIAGGLSDRLGLKPGDKVKHAQFK